MPFLHKGRFYYMENMRGKNKPCINNLEKSYDKHSMIICDKLDNKQDNKHKWFYSILKDISNWQITAAVLQFDLKKIQFTFSAFFAQSIAMTWHKFIYRLILGSKHNTQLQETLDPYQAHFNECIPMYSVALIFIHWWCKRGGTCFSHIDRRFICPLSSSSTKWNVYKASCGV